MTHLPTASSAGAFPGGLCIARGFARVYLFGCDGLLWFLYLGVLARGCIPVPDDLESQNSIEDEPCNEPVENQRIRNLLEGSEDTRKRSQEIVDNLS